MVARVSRYKLGPDEVRALLDEIVRLAHANPPYDIRLRAAFLFVNASGATATLTVADSREGLLTAPTERHGALPREVVEYDVRDWFIASAPEGGPDAAELTAYRLGDRPPPEGEREGVWAKFVLENAAAGRGMAITLVDDLEALSGDDAARWQPEYFMARHSQPCPPELRAGMHRGLNRSYLR